MTVDIDTLSQWRSGITRDIERLRQQIAPLEEAVKRKEEELLALDRLLALQDAVPEELAHEPRQRGGSRTRKGFLEAAADVLRQEGKPLHYRALYEKLASGGVHIPGRDPAANLLSHIARDERFAWSRRGTYGLAEWGGPSRAKRKSRRRKSAR